MPAKMSTSMRVEDTLNGAANFRSWKHRVLLILEENELLDHVKKVLPEPKEEEANAKFKRNEVKAKRIITNSIKDHLIPNVSELKTPKEMFDALTKLYESKNTSRKLTLRHQLRNSNNEQVRDDLQLFHEDLADQIPVSSNWRLHR
jgi:hypothetical protein